MVFYTPPLQRLPTPVTPPTKDRSVLGVNRIEERRREDRGKGEGRSLRHRLLDMVMEEVESLPELSPPQKQRIRHNLGRFAQNQPDQPPHPLPPPPTTPEHAAAVVADLLGEDDSAPSDEDGAVAVHLASEMRRLLSLHSDRAMKIASYIHALMAVTPDSHQVDLDI